MLPRGDTTRPTPNRILLINPFYAKDPHASFGKHVLTPTLALTSIAAATPPQWDVAYWDENLLQGAPPTPYPGTPLFAQLESERRILHRDWSRYDTAHVVFQPKNMTADELYEGYAATYRRLFSHRSIWRRRPADSSAVMPYLGMSYLYKKSNRLWPWIIRHRLTHALWSPLVELSRRRQVRWRTRASGTSFDRLDASKTRFRRG